jgi:flagellar basal body-associated protein FliL
MLTQILPSILPLADAFDLVRDIFTLIIVVVIVAVIASIALVGFLLVYGAEKCSNPQSKREKNAQWSPAGRFCSHCGSQNESDAVFCKKCGRKLS